MDIILLVLHVFLSLGIITLVLLQKGAGASAGASFGGGAGSVFGASGSSNFLSKTTALFAIGFFVNSLVLAYMASHREVQTDSVLDALTVPAVEESSEMPFAADVPAPEMDVPAPEGDAAVEGSTKMSSEEEVPPPESE